MNNTNNQKEPTNFKQNNLLICPPSQEPALFVRYDKNNKQIIVTYPTKQDPTQEVAIKNQQIKANAKNKTELSVCRLATAREIIELPKAIENAHNRFKLTLADVIPRTKYKAELLKAKLAAVKIAGTSAEGIAAAKALADEAAAEAAEALRLPPPPPPRPPPPPPRHIPIADDNETDFFETLINNPNIDNEAVRVAQEALAAAAAPVVAAAPPPYTTQIINRIILAYEEIINTPYIAPLIKDREDHIIEHNKQIGLLKHEVDMLNDMLLFPTNWHLEDYILFDQFLNDIDLTDSINSLKEALKIERNNKISITLSVRPVVLSNMGNRKLLSLIVLFSRLFHPPLIKSTSYKPKDLINNLIELFENGTILPPTERNTPAHPVFNSSNILISFQRYIQYSGTINIKFYQTLTNGDLLYDIYKQNYMNSSNPIKLTKQLIKNRIFKWLTDDDIFEFPISYIFNQYSLGAKKELDADINICSEISTYPTKYVTKDTDKSELPPSPFHPELGTDYYIPTNYVNSMGPSALKSNLSKMRNEIKSTISGSTMGSEYGEMVGGKHGKYRKKYKGRATQKINRLRKAKLRKTRKYSSRM